MRRRDFLGVLGGAAVAFPFGTQAQQAQKQHRIAFVHSGIPADLLTEAAGPFWVRRFYQTLRALGDTEAGNLVVERYSAEGRSERFVALAAAVVGRNPDVILANSNSLVKTFTMATATIPIVGITADPIAGGLVTSLAHPGGNLTGVSIDAGFEIVSKRLQILKEALPQATKVAYLLSNAGDERMMSSYRDYADLGGLITYAPDLGELAQRLANDVHQILNGAKAGDIPFYQPSTFQLLINLKAARVLDLNVPSSLLLRADEVIE